MVLRYSLVQHCLLVVSNWELEMRLTQADDSGTGDAGAVGSAKTDGEERGGGVTAGGVTAPQHMQFEQKSNLIQRLSASLTFSLHHAFLFIFMVFHTVSDSSNLWSDECFRF